jgi:hypothetical protein
MDMNRPMLVLDATHVGNPAIDQRCGLPLGRLSEENGMTNNGRKYALLRPLLLDFFNDTQ